MEAQHHLGRPFLDGRQVFGGNGIPCRNVNTVRNAQSFGNDGVHILIGNRIEVPYGVGAAQNIVPIDLFALGRSDLALSYAFQNSSTGPESTAKFSACQVGPDTFQSVAQSRPILRIPQGIQNGVLAQDIGIVDSRIDGTVQEFPGEIGRLALLAKNEP